MKLKPLWRVLFDYWRIVGKLSHEDVVQEIENRFMKPFCFGPGSMEFRCFPHPFYFQYDDYILNDWLRDSWHFHADKYGCVDECLDLSRKIDLEPRCFEKDFDYCVTPEIRAACVTQASATFGSCFRTWARLPLFSHSRSSFVVSPDGE